MLDWSSLSPKEEQANGLLLRHVRTGWHLHGCRRTHQHATPREPYDAVNVLAQWCFWHGEDFEDTILRAANLGDDADTTAAIAGQLAGAYYGAEAVPKAWREQLALGDEIAALAQHLAEGAYDTAGNRSL